MGRLPESTNFLCLAPGRKGLLFDGEDHELFQVFRLGIGETAFPVAHSTAGDAKHIGQCGLRQTDLGAHGQDGLSKGVVSIAVEISLHGRSVSVSLTYTHLCEAM